MNDPIVASSTYLVIISWFRIWIFIFDRKWCDGYELLSLIMTKKVSDQITRCMFGFTFSSHICVLRFCSFFIYFFFFTRFGETWLLFMYCSLNSNSKCWIFCSKQYINVLFIDSQIPLFSNFFIKNGFHGTIYIFKNYFVTVFSVFSFQFQ